MSTPMKPNKKYEHLYAIVRYDLDADDDLPLDLRITVKKIMTDGNRAAEEVLRLNKLNADKGVYYFSQVTRFEPSQVDSVPVPSLDLVNADAQDSRATS